MDFGTSVDNALKILDRAYAAGRKYSLLIQISSSILPSGIRKQSARNNQHHQYSVL